MMLAYEIHGDRALVASTSDATTALVLAREWLREPGQVTSNTHTCVVQIRRDGELVGEHIVALGTGPWAADRPPNRCDRRGG